MALIKCPGCNQEVSDRAIKCPSCGYILNEEENNKNIAAAKTKKNRRNSFALKMISLLIAVVATCVLLRGFYVKNVYDYENSYVGGDAYNYIINGTYFAGFMALSGALYICATGLLCTSIVLKRKNEEENETAAVEELPSI